MSKKQKKKTQTHQKCAHKDLQHSQYEWQHWCLLALISPLQINPLEKVGPHRFHHSNSYVVIGPITCTLTPCVETLVHV